MLLRTARLTPDEEDKVITVENRLNGRIVALAPVEETAELSSEATLRLTEMERELGVVLVAYQATDPRTTTDSSGIPASFTVSCEFQPLDDEEQRILQRLEDELSVMLLCYRRP